MLNRWKIKAAAGLLSCGFFLFSGDVTSDSLPPAESRKLSPGSLPLSPEEEKRLVNETDYAFLFSRLAKKDPRKSIADTELEKLLTVLEKEPASTFLVISAIMEYKKLSVKEKKKNFAEKFEKIAGKHPEAFSLVSAAADIFSELGSKETSAVLLQKSVSLLLTEKDAEKKAEYLKKEKKEYALYIFRCFARLLTEKKEYGKAAAFLQETFEKDLFCSDPVLRQYLMLNNFYLLENADDQKANKLFFWQPTNREKAEKAFAESVEEYKNILKKMHRETKSINLPLHNIAFQILSRSKRYKELPLSILLSELLAGKENPRLALLFLADHFAIHQNEANSARIWKRLLELPGFPVNSTPFLIHALKSSRSGNFTEAVKAQEKAYICEPHDPRIALTLARMYMQAEKKEKAYKILESFFPDPEALHLAAGFRMHDNETGKALQLYLRLDELMARKVFPPPGEKDKKVPLTKNGELLSTFITRQLQIALCAEKLSRYDLLEKHLKKILAADPGNSTALNFFGYSLAQRNKNLPFAEQLLLLALEKEPSNYAFLDSLAWIKYRKKEYKEAKKHILKAIENAGQDVDMVIYDHAGDIFYASGEILKAIKYWDLALNTYSNEVNIDQLLEKLALARKKTASDTHKGSTGK
ncbi:MAG: hypothetical protein IKA79_07410 [Lentisphaeria bacterium]|nr:hypothetical protein [Lentisphaeria bacterium]